MAKLLKPFLLLILVTIWVPQTDAKEKPYPHFSHLETRHGLSQNTINVAFQDNEGFMWFGTENGLNRYDGLEVVTFVPEPEKENTISGHIIKSIVQDATGIIWIGTQDGGLSQYNPVKQEFKHIQLIETKPNEPYLSIRSLKLDENDTLWIGTARNGLLSYSSKTNSVSRYINPVNTIYTSYINTLENLEAGRLLIGTAKGIFLFDTIREEYINLESPYKALAALKNNHISKLFYSSEKQLWIGTQRAGTYQLNLQFKRLLGPESPLLSQIRGHRIFDITEDYDKNIWLSTPDGLHRIISDTSVEHYQRQPNHLDSLNENQIISLYIDRKNLLWAGSYNRGVNKLDLHTQQFRHLASTSAMNNCVGTVLSSVIVDSKGRRWIGSADGLYRLSADGTDCRHFQHQHDDATSLSHNIVTDILEDSNNTVWIATVSGLNQFQEDSLSFKVFKNSEQHRVLPSNTVYSLFEDHQAQLWLGTRQGVAYKSKIANEFKPVNIEDMTGKNLTSNKVFSIAEDNHQQLWFGTKKGLNLYDPRNNQLQHFTTRQELPYRISSDRINDIYADKNGNVWIATENGLLHRDNNDKTFTTFNQQHGFPTNALYAILSDQQHRLWISSNKGIFRFNPTSNETLNFGLNDGLQGLEFTGGRYFDHIQSNMYFTGTNGLTHFDPDKVIANPLDAKPIISNVYLHNTKINLSNDGNSPFTHAPNYTDAITLSHQQNALSIEFASDHHASPTELQYAYRLNKGNWIYTGQNNRRATLNNLSPGIYQLEVKAKNHDGRWGNPIHMLSIEVLPPIWLTVWAKVIYVIFILSVLSIIYRLRTRAIRKHSEQLEAEVKLRTEELAQEKNLVDQLLDKKQREVVNMSHELRTPLTLILGPVVQLLKTESNDQKKRTLSVIKNNADRLLRLVNQLLQIEKLNVDKIKPNEATTQADTVIDVICQSFESLANNKNIVINKSLESGTFINIGLESYEKIIINLISNAIKYTRENGRISVSLTQEKSTASVIVADNGIGIPVDRLETIFERFYRVPGTKTQTITGSGIGLSLVKEIVDAHQGSISVKSEPQQGSEFKVTLPLSKHSLLNNSDDLSSDQKREALQQEIQRFYSFDNFTPAKDVHYSGVIRHDKTQILIIEDNPEMQTYIQSLLCKSYHCILANDGEEGLSLANHHVPDLIISDIMMPGIDGFEVSKTLKSNVATSHIPLILLTAKSDKQSRLSGWHSNADEFISKPFDDDELIARVENLLEIRQLMQQRNHQTIEKTLLSQSPHSNESLTNSNEHQFIEKFRGLLNKRYYDADLKVNDIAKELAMSERQLFRKIKALLNVTPADYLRSYRLEKACEMLKTGSNAGEVAIDVGFSSHTYFSKCFKAKFGTTPSQYIVDKNKNRNSDQHSNTEELLT
ncbi:hybrid sensor histidine kinase/response regulator transcription factor [Pleionea sediminis]|uniref:hybrid sensor histidine kinase/response regulator transcription factor n=1 Tax=Pleionea sediminis TaxID=2569479 RepID=UPI0013DDAE5C|nr:two-component regulator propeller domain-containing protein [Pleionea sediminis]